MTATTEMTPLQDELAELWRAGWPYIQLCTADEERATRVLEGVARQAQAPLFIWSSGRASQVAADSAAEALAAFTEGSGPALLALFDLEVSAPAQSSVAKASEGTEPEGHPSVVSMRVLRDAAPTLEASGRVVVWVRPEAWVPPALSEVLVSLPLPRPDAHELRHLLATLHASAQATLAPTDTPIDAPRDADPEARFERLAGAALGLSEAQATRALRSALAAKTDDEAVSCVLREKRRRMGQGESIELIDGHFSLDDVGGLENLKRWLKERAGAFGERAQAFGLPAPRGVLLLGVQGCGKSMSAKVIAHEFGVPLLRLDLSSVFGGESAPEGAMRRALETAERFAPAVLWIDEIEKGFAGADSEGQVVSTTSARILGSFVTWMQEKKAPVFVVATANEVRSLPPELLRRGRFDEIFFLDLPAAHAREDILRVHLRRAKRRVELFELEPLVRQTAHFSGAELEQVVVTALLRAFTEKRELTQADLVRAAADMVPLYRTYEERIKALRVWARHRTRHAGSVESVAELLLATQLADRQTEEERAAPRA